MKNKTKIREFLEGDLELDALVDGYDLEEEESYSQALINPRTVKGRRKREYADDDGDLAGSNGYGASYADEGENGYGTTDDKQNIIDAETVFDKSEDQGNGEV